MAATNQEYIYNCLRAAVWIAFDNKVLLIKQNLGPIVLKANRLPIAKRRILNQLHWLGVEEMHLSVRPHWVKGDRLWAWPSDWLKKNKIWT